MENEEIKPTSTIKNIYNFIIKTSSLMAIGLFATLIIGTIINQIGVLTTFTPLAEIGTVVQAFMGIGIGLAIATYDKENSSPIRIVSMGVAGGIASAINFSFDLETNPFVFTFSFTGGSKNPLLIYLVVIFAMLITRIVLKKKTPVDLIIVPLFICILASVLSVALVIPCQYLINGLSSIVETATTYQPFLMGIVISVLMGMALTAPISSVAIAVAIHLSGIGAGAAVVGCSVQMIGFMMMSIKDNNIGKIISVGIGTSMLQFSNILKKPIIWLPTIIVSAILGPISTCVLGLECNSVGAGMGTCALIGPIQVVLNTPDLLKGLLGATLLCVVVPAGMVFGLYLLFLKLGWIKKGDLAI